MNDAAIHRQYHPERSPMLGLAALVATAATLGLAVLLPAHYARNAAIAPAQPGYVQAPMQIVTLPAVEVVGTRQTQAAQNSPGTPPVAVKKNG